MHIINRTAIALTFFGLTQAASAGLIISEYVEGTGNNKAIELFNPGNAIDLATGQFSLAIYFNGSATPGSTIALSGTIDSGASFVIAKSTADAELLNFADFITGALNFNGDDAIVLFANDIVIDSVGQIGVDPGVEWGTGDSSTQDNSLVRQSFVTAGDTNPSDTFNPAAQWLGFPLNTFTGLGQHVVDNVAPPVNLNGGINDLAPATTVDAPPSLLLFGLGLLILFGYAQRTRSFARSNVNTQ